MTIIEMFKTKTVEEIADDISKAYYYETEPGKGRPCNCLCDAFDMDWFPQEEDCPEECIYLEDWHNYEDSWINGICDKEDHACPYKISRQEIFKRQLIEWLNTEIKELD